MEQLKISFIPILIAVAVNFILGFIWYTPLFGKTWGREMGFDMTQKPKSSAMLKGMLIMAIGNFLFAWVLAHNIAAWTFVPGTQTLSHFSSAMMSAIFTWLGFYLPVDLGAIAWEQKSVKLFFINTGYHLASLIIVSIILVFA